MEFNSENNLETTEQCPQNGSNKNVATEVTTDNMTTNAIVESEFTRVNVESLGSAIRKFDEDETTGLELFCYVRCSPTDEGLIRQCRGVVFHKQEVVMKAFPYTVEYNNNEREKIDENITPVFDECSVYQAQEGALIRMFNFGGKWYTSTHRKLDAFRSKWASRESFGSSFKKALEQEISTNTALSEALPEGVNVLERFQSILDPEKQYMFLVRNTFENRIVCSPPENPTLYHVGTFVNGNLVMTEDIHIPYPLKLDFNNVSDLLNYVSNIDPNVLQGVIVFAPQNKQYKILHKDYQDLFRARGNEPSIKFRYLQVRMNRKHTAMLYHLYPEEGETFDQYENTLYEISKSIYRSYVQRFLMKRYVSVPREEFAVIRDCHSWHLKNREENKISQEKIIEVLNQQSPTNLNKMIRRFNTEQASHNNTHNTRTRSNSMTSNKSAESPAVSGITPTLVPLLQRNNAEIPPLNL